MKEDGGPAFPRPTTVEDEEYKPGDVGMSLRDYLAAQALNGLTSGDHWMNWIGDESLKEKKPQEVIALFSYAIADAMLEQRIYEWERENGPKPVGIKEIK